MSIAPQVLHVGGSSISRCNESMESMMADPRGLLWMWHSPKPNSRYVISCDPTMGVTGWSRAMKQDGDEKIDNCAIEIFEPSAIRMDLLDDQGNRKIDPQTKQPMYVMRDMQVAEYAGPVDAVEAARICRLLGRIYQGVDDEYALLIYESWPGPGILTTQELLRLGYSNIWMWEYITGQAEETNRMGWQSSFQSQKVLWYRSRRHLMERKAKIYSKFLVDEYSNAVIDLEKMRAKAAYGYHDDRMQAANMAFWACHKWSYDEEVAAPVTTSVEVDYQTLAPTLDHRDAWTDEETGAVSHNYRDAWKAEVDNWLD